MMKNKITHIEPKYRCKFCNRPLDFSNNHILTDDEIEEKEKNYSWFRRNFFPSNRFEIDCNRQYWTCHKCNEVFLIDKNEKEVLNGPETRRERSYQKKDHSKVSNSK